MQIMFIQLNTINMKKQDTDYIIKFIKEYPGVLHSVEYGFDELKVKARIK